MAGSKARKQKIPKESNTINNESYNLALAAQIIIAAAAVIGLLLSVYQSIRASSALEASHQAFESFTYPIVKFIGYSFNNSTDSSSNLRPLSCKIPRRR